MKPSAPSSNDSVHAHSRRRVLSAAAAAWATVSIVPRHVLGAGQVAPSAKPRLAAVGVGGVGFGQVQACQQAGFDVTVLCDLDDAYAKKAYDRWPQARRYRDFRDMLHSEADRIDAVYCGTPDHTHALISLAALRAKKHVCCVKPLTRTLHECDVVAAAAQKAGVATQVTASPNTGEAGCRTCELIWAGAIGAVREVHVWSERPWWPQGMMRPAGADPVPATFDWKLWLGPSPERPFKATWDDGSYPLEQVNIGGKPFYKSVYHPWNFRGWWDFGTGALGDMGCHHLNIPFRALKLTHCTHVQAHTTKRFPETAPLASIVSWDFPARGEMPPVRITWYDGGMKPPRPLEMPAKMSMGAEGVLYVGDEGKMLNEKILDPERAKKFAGVPRTLERRPGTWGEWFQACTGGEKAGCAFDWASLLTEFVLLGNVAIRTGGLLEWDGARRQFTNSRAADALVNPTYHNGWTLEG